MLEMTIICLESCNRFIYEMANQKYYLRTWNLEMILIRPILVTQYFIFYIFCHFLIIVGKS